MGRIFTRRTMADARRRLRRTMTAAEICLWSKLKERRLHGCKFRRQHSIGPFVVDFYCAERGLVIELDGPVHETPDAMEYDSRRQEFIEALQIRVIRFRNEDVLNNLESVLTRIERELEGRAAVNG